MLGDNYCTSCCRAIPASKFWRTWCDACLAEIERRMFEELRRASESMKRTDEDES
jgi:hypothetical protein